MIQRTIAILLLAAPLAVAGCGREVLGAGQGGDVSTAVVDDPSPAPSSAAGPSYSRAGTGAAAATGTVEAVLGVEVVRTDGRVVALTDPGSSVSLRLSSPDSVVLEVRRVPSGSYTTARVTVRRVTAAVTGGLDVGGVGILGRVDVEITEPVVVERPIQLTVGERTRSQLAVDLNSELWLQATVPLRRVVPAAAFASAVAVRAR